MNNFIQRGLTRVVKQQLSSPESIKRLGDVLDTVIHTRTIEKSDEKKFHSTPQINSDEYIR